MLTNINLGCLWLKSSLFTKSSNFLKQVSSYVDVKLLKEKCLKK